MRWSWRYARITLVLFACECLIAGYVHDDFIRPFVGDVLVLILLYAAFRTVLKANSSNVLIGVLVLAFLVETLQAFHFIEIIGLSSNKIARIVVGNTFDWFDLLAYLVGAVFAFFGDKLISKRAL